MNKKNGVQLSESTQRLLRTRFAGSILENASVLLITLIRYNLPQTRTLNVKNRGEKKEKKPKSKLRILIKNAIISIANCILMEDGLLLLHHLISNKLYSFVPHFSASLDKQKERITPFNKHGIYAWLKGNAYLIIGGGIALGILESIIPQSWADEINETKFPSPIKFLKNFVLFRLVADSFFYVFHRTLHQSKWLYEMIHRRHHSHYQTSLSTNHQFTAVDLFLENALPMFLGMGFVRSTGVKMGRFEMYLIMNYWAWYNVGVHTAKDLKIISMFPPIAFIYNQFFNIDDGAIRFHEAHHNKRHVYYGITPWLDNLLGTNKYRS